jgi:hypothetical protein
MSYPLERRPTQLGADGIISVARWNWTDYSTILPRSSSSPLGNLTVLRKEKNMTQEISGKQPTSETRPFGIMIVAGLMILFGLAEVVTGFRHEFFGLTTTQVAVSTYIGVALGLFYFVGGLLILTKKKWAAVVAIVLLCGDVIGRIAMVITGLYPVNSFMQTFAIIVGTSIAASFAAYIGLKLKYFD